VSADKADIVIIGGGPGGYVSAIRAAQLGLSTTLIEREHLGGICLNWGCIPTKALLRTSELFQLMQHADEFGISVEGISFDLDKVVKRSRKVSAKLAGGVKFLLKKNKVTVIDGEAKLLGGGKVAITSTSKDAPAEITAKHIIVATGARARTIGDLKPDGKRIWTYKEAMLPDTMPEKLLVIGSGAIGIEFASFYNALGSDVTVVEVMDRILPIEDAEISALAQKSFTKQGMTFHTGTTVEGLKSSPKGISATLKASNGDTTQFEASHAILAIGISGNVENIGLEDAGVNTDRGHIIIDEWCQTSADGVYAIGDVAGPPWLAHKASHEGILCIEKISGIDGVHPLNTSNVPGCTYSNPQVASIGLTEEAAAQAGHDIRVGRFPYQGNGKAIALGEPEGMIKTIFDKATGELLGAHMIGAEVTELIQGYGIAKTLETTEAELMHTIFPHPTLSEMMHESVLDAYGRVIHS